MRSAVGVEGQVADDLFALQNRHERLAFIPRLKSSLADLARRWPPLKNGNQPAVVAKHFQNLHGHRTSAELPWFGRDHLKPNGVLRHQVTLDPRMSYFHPLQTFTSADTLAR